MLAGASVGVAQDGQPAAVRSYEDAYEGTAAYGGRATTGPEYCPTSVPASGNPEEFTACRNAPMTKSLVPCGLPHMASLMPPMVVGSAPVSHVLPIIVDSPRREGQ